MLFEKWAANRLAMLESTPRRLLCLREPFSQQSSRVPPTLDNVGQCSHRRLGDEPEPTQLCLLGLFCLQFILTLPRSSQSADPATRSG